MKSKPRPAYSRAEEAVYSISASTRQLAQEADAHLVAKDWLYTSPSPPRRAGAALATFYSAD
ncbi:hypothetical protein A0257_22440 (plasmid) [Hymenobacter psoromatis]|nr:hypothetical protein A0257_22440 [Hymenobacter psoromatis]